MVQMRRGHAGQRTAEWGPHTTAAAAVGRAQSRHGDVQRDETRRRRGQRAGEPPLGARVPGAYTRPLSGSTSAL